MSLFIVHLITGRDNANLIFPQRSIETIEPFRLKAERRIAFSIVIGMISVLAKI